MGRKLVLISVLTVITDTATTYLWTSFLTNFVALILTLQCKPYVDPLMDQNEVLYCDFSECLHFHT